MPITPPNAPRIDPGASNARRDKLARVAGSRNAARWLSMHEMIAEAVQAREALVRDNAVGVLGKV